MIHVQHWQCKPWTDATECGTSSSTGGYICFDKSNPIQIWKFWHVTMKNYNGRNGPIKWFQNIWGEKSKRCSAKASEPQPDKRWQPLIIKQAEPNKQAGLQIPGTYLASYVAGPEVPHHPTLFESKNGGKHWLFIWKYLKRNRPWSSWESFRDEMVGQIMR